MRYRIVMLFVVSLSFSACQHDAQPRPEARDFSTPAKRLVGRWQSADIAFAMNECEYFGPLNPQTKVGTFIRYRISKSEKDTSQPMWKQFDFNYRVISEDPMGTRVTVNLLFANGDSRPESYYLEHDGSVRTSHSVSAGLETSTKGVYMDGKNLPCSAK
jgi:hypothetical protein